MTSMLVIQNADGTV